ncbi:MAG: 5-bromo-4-chloroindolyl phosphate hydrolysis family protein [Pseudomonadota bacterium]
MSKRFGGKFSNQEMERGVDWSTAKPRRSRFRTQVIAALSIPIFVAGALELTSGNPIGAIFDWGAALGVALASWLISEGIRAEIAFNERQIANPPAFPRKMFGTVLIAVSVGSVFALDPDWGPFNGILVGAIAGGLAFATFGIDPMRSKGLEGTNTFERERVAVAIEKAETYLEETLDAAGRIRDRHLNARIESLVQSVREMMRTIENDPRDLSSSRKYLSVYLKGARDATRKFADLYSKRKDKEARNAYVALLDDLERSFSQRREILLLDNRTDLDVEIEVLRERLAASNITD